MKKAVLVFLIICAAAMLCFFPGCKKELLVNDFDINYPILIDNTIDNVSPGWKVSGIPTTFILNKNSEILSSSVGMMTKGQLIKAIEEAL